MSRASPKKSKSTSIRESVREQIITKSGTSLGSTIYRSSFDFEIIERLNAVEVENVHLRTKIVSIEEKNTIIANLHQDNDILKAQLARSENDNRNLKNECGALLESKKGLE
jgi:hypothetical protein